MKNTTNLGTRIRTIRETKQITSEQIAQQSGLTPEQIVQIEEGEYQPSLAPVVKIARALGVRLGTFLDDSENLGPVICRKDAHNKGVSFSSNTSASHNNLDFFPLAVSKSGRHMEPFIIEIDSESNSGYLLSSHEGEEFLYVLEGEVEVSYGKSEYKLNQGDSIYYDSIVDHNVHAANTSGAKILAVVYTPF
jgi:transcriptional regulator with XRE-family HTH domain